MRLYIFFFYFFITTTALLADALRTNGGQLVQGKIVSETDAVVVIQTREGTFTFDKKDILEIEKAGTTPIARDPSTAPSPLKAAMLSFIPGYSGLYQTQYAGGGVPLAIAGLYLFSGVAQTTFAKQPVGFNSGQSVSGKEFRQFTLPGLLFAGPGHFNGLFPMFIYGSAVQAATVKDYRVLGVVHRQNEMSGLRSKTIRNFLLLQGVNAGLSFAAIKLLAPPATTAVAELPAGANVSVIATSTGSDGVGFGLGIAF